MQHEGMVTRSSPQGANQRGLCCKQELLKKIEMQRRKKE